MTTPAQKPGRSQQVVLTPPDFLLAVTERLGIDRFDADLAACDYHNAVAPRYYTPRVDALTQPWKLGDGWNWLNPEFADLAPWVEKSYTEARDHGAHTAVLVPAGVGANWWREWVHHKADVLFLNGRITFVGHTAPYPKDCALLLYHPISIAANGMYDVWRWKDSLSVDAVDPVGEQVTGSPRATDLQASRMEIEP